LKPTNPNLKVKRAGIKKTTDAKHGVKTPSDITTDILPHVCIVTLASNLAPRLKPLSRLDSPFADASNIQKLTRLVLPIILSKTGRCSRSFV
jgi:hypothetical protein